LARSPAHALAAGVVSGTMESCERIQYRLLDFIEGELADGEFRQIEAHLARCARCGREAAALRATVARVRDLPVSAVPDGLLDGLAAAVQKRIASDPTHRPPFWQRLARWIGGLPGLQPVPAVSAAAALGLLLAIGLGHGPRVPHAPSTGDGVVAAESLSIAQNLDLLEQFDLLEELDVLEQLPLLRSPVGDQAVKRG
jgi:anti-sigma factor RsiW